MIHPAPLIVLLMLCAAALRAQPLPLDVRAAPRPLREGHLRMGGSNPQGDQFAVNSFFVTHNGKPFIPVTGEFHFFRYPPQYWEESLRKMKAGGINVVATYLFWNVHEENEGRFTWANERDIRRFVELCRQHDLYAIIRIGPFCHGEIRNGGLPDWLLGRPVVIRSNDPAYLAYVEKWYNQIGKQLQGLYFKDGGNIIGIQIENEYQHSASPWGLTYPGQAHDWTAAEQDLGATHQGVSVATADNPYAQLGNDHMGILKSLAVKAGMVTPLYTATGWGYAAIAEYETIPVTAAYAYPFWTEKKDLSPFFLYKNMHAQPDYAPVRYEPRDYPAFAAELGSGIMSVYTRRPIVDQKSMDALINRCLGSGANGIGYYMYHGGTTPKGEQAYFADEAYGLPKLSYDFQAPIGEYGQLREGFHRLKLLHFFTRYFGETLAPMDVVLPTNADTLRAENLHDVRYAARARNGAGFLFVQNFQDDAVVPDKTNIQVGIQTQTGTVNVPASGGFDLKSGENAIFPFQLDLNGVTLQYATAQPMAKGVGPAGPYWVFFVPEGVRPEFWFAQQKGLVVRNAAGCAVDQNNERWLVTCPATGASEFKVSNGRSVTHVLVIDKATALQSYTVPINGRDHIIFSEATVLANGDALDCRNTGSADFRFSVYPPTAAQPQVVGGTLVPDTPDVVLRTYRVQMPAVDVPVALRQVSERKWALQLPAAMPAGLSDLWLHIDYVGDTGMGFLDGTLVADEFYKGMPWQIGMRRFYPSAAGKDMVFYFRPMPRNAPYLNDLQPESVPVFDKSDNVLSLRGMRWIPEYRCTIQF
jgi:hypothetical protein